MVYKNILQIIIPYCIVVTACSTGYKTGQNKLTYEKTITILNAELPLMEAEKHLLVSDYVPQFCTSAVNEHDNLFCIASFADAHSYLWACNEQMTGAAPVMVPNSPVMNLLRYEQRFAAVQYKETGYMMILADSSFTMRKEFVFPYSSTLTPVLFSNKNKPCVAWVEKSNTWQVKTAVLEDNGIGAVQTMAESQEEIYELTAFGNDASLCFAYTSGDELMVFLAQNGKATPLFNNGSDLHFIEAGHQLFLTATVKNAALNTSQLLCVPVKNKETPVPDTVVALSGYTAIYSAQPVAGPGTHICFSIVTTNRATTHKQGSETGSLGQYIVAYNPDKKTAAILGRTDAPGLLHHNGYIHNNKLVLLHAHTKINLSVFPLNIPLK